MLFLWCFRSASVRLFSGQLPLDVDPADEQGDERCKQADQYAPVERLNGAVQDNRPGERRDAVAAQKYVDPFKLSPQLLGRMGACVPWRLLWCGFRMGLPVVHGCCRVDGCQYPSSSYLGFMISE